MPPQAKFTREEIIAAAFQIARTDGPDRITARELGARLGSSARPVFTVFKNMDEVRAEVIAEAKKLYRSYIAEGLQQELAFGGVGEAYIRFAMEEPALFRLLFMSGEAKEVGVENILPQIDESYEEILQSVQKYVKSRQAADMIYQHLWTYAHGIAVMCVTGLCSYTMEQISERMMQVFVGLLLLEKKNSDGRTST